jgi:hypothetical protein
MDQLSFSKLDLDPYTHSRKKLDLDPHEGNKSMRIRNTACSIVPVPAKNPQYWCVEKIFSTETLSNDEICCVCILLFQHFGS